MSKTKEHKKGIIMLFASLMVIMLMASLSQMIFSTALPTIVGELHGVEHMSWVITAYMLASTITMPIYGKLSDQYGRKPLLIVAILLFLGGSIIGMFAGDMSWLIISRVVQGLGGGGLMILAQTAVADVVPARERGKYVGVMGGVFALSSVAGPLLGGCLTESLSWRWAFILNVPLAIIALVAISVLLHLPKKARGERHTQDYLGMAVLAGVTTALILATTWGGATYAWDSWQILSLFGGAILGAIAFIFIELKAKEPVIPMYLFKERNFVLTTIAGMLIAVAMFGAAGYMPTYFQMAEGIGASAAGLLMSPMMAAMLLTSVIVGAVVSKTGKYKVYPIVGAAVLSLGLYLLSTTTVDTHVAMICVDMAVVGVGLGLSMQILTLIVQNTFAHKLVGTATAASNFFRQVGSSLGASIVGALFTSRLADGIAKLHMGSGGSGSGSSLTPDLLKSLPDAVRNSILSVYNDALIPIFLYLVPLGVISLVLLVFIREKKLADEIKHEATSEGLAEGQVLTSEYEGAKAVK